MFFCCQCLTMMSHEWSARENDLRIFTLVELQEITKKFGQSSETGESGFGSLHVGVVKSLTFPYDNIHVAVKWVKKRQMVNILRERLVFTGFIANIKHQNVVKLIGYYLEDTGNEIFLVYEYLPKGSLDGHLSSLPWSMRLRIAKDAATGLAYLHANMDIFKDFNPSKILLDDNMNAKLLYSGFLEETSPVTTSVEVTTGYSAPEAVKEGKGRITFKMDVWSYGIFLQELIKGGFPVAEENVENNPECMRWVCCYAGEEISKLSVDPILEGKYSEKSMQAIASIANKCLILEPKRRPKMSKVLKLVTEAMELEVSSEQLLNAAYT